jgi:glyoxylate reductase
MSQRVLLTLPLPPPAAQILEATGAEVVVAGRIPASEELVELLATGFDVICPQLADRIDDHVLAAGGERLRAVCIYAVGYNNVDVAAATRRGVLVANTPGVLTDATADCALGLLIAAARRLCEGDADVRAGRWTGWAPEHMLGLELRGSLLGIVGMGRIGQALAVRALACGMRVAYAERDGVKLEPGLAAQVEPMPLDRLLREADAISLHLPLSDSTRHLIDETALRSMKPTAVLVNTARGAVIDEGALVRALQEGWIAAAGLDVYEDEPRLAPGLIECRNAVLSPHLGSATVRTRSEMARLCAENAAAALSGAIPPHPVNPQAWPR